METTDKEIVSNVIMDDEKSIQRLFFEKCTPIFQYIVRKIFDYQVEENELINEFYLYLKENDWYKLRQFDYRYKLTTWISIVAYNFFKRKRDELIINKSTEYLLTEQITDNYVLSMMDDDVEILLGILRNKRYRFVIRKLILENDEPQKIANEMCITVNNLYAIKFRALQQFQKIIEKKQQNN
jgi:DNA-directed RNA polymerase specialized sigma24 family protein